MYFEHKNVRAEVFLYKFFKNLYYLRDQIFRGRKFVKIFVKYQKEKPRGNLRDERDTWKQRYIHSLCITIILPEVSNRKEAGLDVL